MKKIGFLLVAILVAFATSYLSVEHFTDASPLTKHSNSETPLAYDRVMETQTLRCGYQFWEPGVILNLQTNTMEGAVVEIVDAISEVTGLKIEWTEQVDWGQVATAVNSGRVDAICAGYWGNARMGKHLDFSILYYEGVKGFVRQADVRFDETLSAINDPSITIAVIDEDISHNIAREDFPKAKILTAPQLSAEDELALMVATGKADITFISAGTGQGFMRENPEKIRQLGDTAFRTFPGTITVGIKDQALKALLDSALRQLHASGRIEKILRKYNAEYPGLFMRVDDPYRILE